MLSARDYHFAANELIPLETNSSQSAVDDSLTSGCVAIGGQRVLCWSTTGNVIHLTESSLSNAFPSKSELITFDTTAIVPSPQIALLDHPDAEKRAVCLLVCDVNKWLHRLEFKHPDNLPDNVSILTPWDPMDEQRRYSRRTTAMLSSLPNSPIVQIEVLSASMIIAHVGSSCFYLCTIGSSNNNTCLEVNDRGYISNLFGRLWKSIPYNIVTLCALPSRTSSEKALIACVCTDNTLRIFSTETLLNTLPLTGGEGKSINEAMIRVDANRRLLISYRAPDVYEDTPHQIALVAVTPGIEPVITLNMELQIESPEGLTTLVDVALTGERIWLLGRIRPFDDAEDDNSYTPLGVAAANNEQPSTYMYALDLANVNTGWHDVLLEKERDLSNQMDAYIPPRAYLSEPGDDAQFNVNAEWPKYLQRWAVCFPPPDHFFHRVFAVDRFSDATVTKVLRSVQARISYLTTPNSGHKVVLEDEVVDTLDQQIQMELIQNPMNNMWLVAYQCWSSFLEQCKELHAQQQQHSHPSTLCVVPLLSSDAPLVLSPLSLDMLIPCDVVTSVLALNADSLDELRACPGALDFNLILGNGGAQLRDGENMVTRQHRIHASLIDDVNALLCATRMFHLSCGPSMNGFIGGMHDVSPSDIYEQIDSFLEYGLFTGQDHVTMVNQRRVELFVSLKLKKITNPRSAFLALVNMLSPSSSAFTMMSSNNEQKQQHMNQHHQEAASDSLLKKAVLAFCRDTVATRMWLLKELLVFIVHLIRQDVFASHQDNSNHQNNNNSVNDFFKDELIPLLMQLLKLYSVADWFTAITLDPLRQHANDKGILDIAPIDILTGSSHALRSSNHHTASSSVFSSSDETSFLGYMLREYLATQSEETKMRRASLWQIEYLSSCFLRHLLGYDGSNNVSPVADNDDMLVLNHVTLLRLSRLLEQAQRASYIPRLFELVGLRHVPDTRDLYLQTRYHLALGYFAEAKYEEAVNTFCVHFTALKLHQLSHAERQNFVEKCNDFIIRLTEVGEQALALEIVLNWRCMLRLYMPPEGKSVDVEAVTFKQDTLRALQFLCFKLSIHCVEQCLSVDDDRGARMHSDEAFRVLTTMDNSKSRDDLLNRFVIVLTGRNQLALLNCYPWVHANLHKQVEQILWWKAKTSAIFLGEATNSLNYYSALYAFLTSIRDYRGAAMTMYHYSVKLEETNRLVDNDVLDRHVQALLYVITALTLCPKNPWVAFEGKGTSEDFVPVFPVDEDGSMNENGDDDDGKNSAAADDSAVLFMKRRRMNHGNSHDKLNIVTLENIRGKYHLRLCQYKLKERQSNIIPAFLGVTDTIVLLIENGLVDDAFGLAFMFNMDEKLDVLFEEMTRKCVYLQINRVLVTDENDGVDITMIDTEKEFSDVLSFPSSASAESQLAADIRWIQLQEYLRRFEASLPSPRYSLIVARTILESNHALPLPTWLIRRFKIPLPGFGVADDVSWTYAVPLLRLLLEFHMVREAADYTDYVFTVVETNTEAKLESLRFQPHVTQMNAKRALVQGLPLEYLLDLLATLRVISESPNYHDNNRFMKNKERLEAQLRAYHALV